MRRAPITILAATVGMVTLAAVALAQDQPPAPAPPAPAAAAPLAGPTAPVVNEVKILLDDKAKSDGEIRFLFTPAGGAGKEVRVIVQKGMAKQAVGRDVAKELAVALGEGYKVDQYDDDKVKVAGKNGAKFSLTIAGQTATGLSVRLN